MLCLSLSISVFLPSKGASGGSDEVDAVAALVTTMLERRPKEDAEEEEEEQLCCCFGDRTRATTDGDTLAARPAARGAARLLLPLVLEAAEAQGRAAAGENVARDAIW